MELPFHKNLILIMNLEYLLTNSIEVVGGLDLVELLERLSYGLLERICSSTVGNGRRVNLEPNSDS